MKPIKNQNNCINIHQSIKVEVFTVAVIPQNFTLSIYFYKLYLHFFYIQYTIHKKLMQNLSLTVIKKTGSTYTFTELKF